jgi:SagB-type dehydrogenase family enzyme
MTDPVQIVLGYHERTKHHPQRYARSRGYLDWATQPDPFRRFDGAPQRLLDEVPISAAPAWDALFDAPTLPAQALDRENLSQFFYDALALSAWKEFGENRWSLRVNPSSGNLHPTEGYLLTGKIPGLIENPGLYHYGPYLHALEQRRVWSDESWAALQLPPDSFLVGLTSISWREAWKYGERAFRYCQHDVGHALGALAVSAAVLGWRTRIIENVADETLSALLGVSGQEGPEAESPDVLILVAPSGTAPEIPRERLLSLTSAALCGTPNVLSTAHHDWPIIDVVAEATTRDVAGAPAERPQEPPLPPVTRSRVLPARGIIRQRRSAVSMDGHTSISRDALLLMLRRVQPGANRAVFGGLTWTPSVHLCLFVHRVDGLAPGLYCQVRDPEALPALRAAMRREFEWAPVEGNLFRLREADARGAARMVSCHQDIAADGAFALGMVARFAPSLREHGAWFYRRLHWEAGVIGQVLYLEAEAAGVRATGIGCFFDDAMHDILGLQDDTFQTLYHFTVGGPVEDPRLRTAPPYAHRST